VIKSIPNNTHLIILQHPTETKHPLNTVRILLKTFEKITLFIGEDFSQDLKINTLLSDEKNRCALLYPGQKNQINISQEKNSSEPITHLFMLDGTWRKSKRIFLTSKNIQQLPTLSLAPTETSQYRIRKTPTGESLSTLEAAIMALSFIEPNLQTQSAVNAFTKMIDLQIKRMGREIYQTNYVEKIKK
jgi:DTW domain-containing protein YfiP